MDLIVLVPNVVRKFIGQFPEVQNNAYKYFNYDNRVVDERVDRYDQKPLYKGPENFSDQDYAALVDYARTIINPILAKYNAQVACDDALHTAIRSYNNGLFDGKVKADRFKVLLNSMLDAPKTAKKKTEQVKPLKPVMLKQLGLVPKDVPYRRVRKQDRGPRFVREKGKIVLNK